MLKIMLIITLLKHLFLSLSLSISLCLMMMMINNCFSKYNMIFLLCSKWEKKIHVKWADVAVSIIIQKLYYNIVVVFCCLLLVEIFSLFCDFYFYYEMWKKKLHWFEIEISILFILLSSWVLINDKEVKLFIFLMLCHNISQFFIKRKNLNFNHSFFLFHFRSDVEKDNKN